MKEENQLIQKVKYILSKISTQKDENYMIEIINHSFFELENYWIYRGFSTDYKLKIFLTADIYSKYYDLKKDIINIIKLRINDSTQLSIISIEILPDYDKLELVSSEVKPIYTKWEEINLNQNKLIESLQRSNESLDYQNVGNIARTLMDKLARKVFNSSIHIPEDKSIILVDGKYKNPLNTYIASELKGKSNKGLRKLAQSSIEFVSDAIDLMNATTHKLNAEKHLAELCVISTISAISIIKTVYEMPK